MTRGDEISGAEEAAAAAATRRPGGRTTRNVNGGAQVEPRVKGNINFVRWDWNKP